MKKSEIIEKLRNDEIKALDKQRLGEVEVDLRREMTMIRMDVFSEKGKHVGKQRRLKKALARVLTERNTRSRAAGGM